MIGSVPPYSLDTFRFPFPALAHYAGLAPHSERDLALGVLMVARIVSVAMPPVQLETSALVGLGDRTKHWVSALTMSQPERLALLRVIDAALSESEAIAEMLAELAQTVAGHIDDASQQELRELILGTHRVQSGRLV